jgi:hypothetical protein
MARAGDRSSATCYALHLFAISRLKQVAPTFNPPDAGYRRPSDGTPQRELAPANKSLANDFDWFTLSLILETGQSIGLINFS